MMLILLMNACMLMMLGVIVERVHSVSYVHAFIVLGYLYLVGCQRGFSARGFPARGTIFGDFSPPWGGDGEKYSPAATSGRGSGKYTPPRGFPDPRENTVMSLHF